MTTERKDSLTFALLRAGALVVVLFGGYSLFFAERACGTSYKACAYRASMRSDLRNLVAAQEEYRQARGSYTGDLIALQAETRFAASFGVQLQMLVGSDSGFSAVVTHAALRDDARCEIFVGKPTLPTSATQEGEPWCSKIWTRRSLR